MAGQDPQYNPEGSHNQVFVAPAINHGAVTPSDSTVLQGVRALVIGGAGTVVGTINGVAVTYTVVAGQTLNGVFTKVAAASTATGIVWQG